MSGRHNHNKRKQPESDTEDGEIIVSPKHKHTITQNKTTKGSMISDFAARLPGPRAEDYVRSAVLGEGTFGHVHRSKTRDGELIAVKRVRLPIKGRGGVSSTFLREVSVLQQLNHPCLLPLLEVLCDNDTCRNYIDFDKSMSEDRKGSFYMVFPLMDHDLAGLVSNPAAKFSTPEIKFYMHEILLGLHYLHKFKFIHRDLKTANILVNNNGKVCIADFGLTQTHVKGKPASPLVCTLWYRAPELLLGDVHYDYAIDMWSAGCILAELLLHRPVFTKNDEPSQLEAIFKACGTPTEKTWPGYSSLPNAELAQLKLKYESSFETLFKGCDPVAVDLVERLLTLDPKQRISCVDALCHDFFLVNGGVKPPKPMKLESHYEMHAKEKFGRKNLQIIPEDAYLESITPVLAVRDHVMNLCRILFLIGVIRMGIVRVGMKIDITARNPADAEMLKVRLDTGVTLGELEMRPLFAYALDPQRYSILGIMGSMDDERWILLPSQIASDIKSNIMPAPIAQYVDFMRANVTGPFPLTPYEIDTATLAPVDGEMPSAQVRLPSLFIESRLAFTNDSSIWGTWWTMRCDNLHQKLLANYSPTLHSQILAAFDILDESPIISKSSTLLAQLNMEKLSTYIYYKDFRSAHIALDKLKLASGIKLTLSGQMGRNTKFQTTSYAHPVLQVSLTASTCTQSADLFIPENIPAESDYILERVQLDGSCGSSEIPYMSRVHQGIILGEAILLHTEGVDRALVRPQILAYLGVLLDNPLCYSIQFQALLLRSSLERDQLHLVSRCYNQFEYLEVLLDTQHPQCDGHMEYVWNSLLFPYTTRIESYMEYLTLCEKMNFYQTALAAYEKLDLFESAMLCYVHMGNRVKARSMLDERIRLLNENFMDSKEYPTRIGELYCILGDIEESPEYYQTAWEVSNHTCSRAQRSFGEHLFRIKDLSACTRPLSQALEINSMFPRYWFMLGFAHMELKEWDSAANAFSRVVQIKAGDGEAWNNLAAVHMHRNDHKSAFFALQQSSTLNRDSWKVWENYVTCALKLDLPQEAVLGTSQVLRLRGPDELDLTVIQALSLYGNDSYKKDARAFLASRVASLFDDIADRLPKRADLYESLAQYFHGVDVPDRAIFLYLQSCRFYQSSSSDWTMETLEHVFEVFCMIIQCIQQTDWNHSHVRSASLLLSSCTSKAKASHFNTSSNLDEVCRTLNDHKEFIAPSITYEDDSFADW